MDIALDEGLARIPARRLAGLVELHEVRGRDEGGRARSRHDKAARITVAARADVAIGVEDAVGGEDPARGDNVLRDFR